MLLNGEKRGQCWAHTQRGAFCQVEVSVHRLIRLKVYMSRVEKIHNTIIFLVPPHLGSWSPFSQAYMTLSLVWLPDLAASVFSLAFQELALPCRGGHRCMEVIGPPPPSMPALLSTDRRMLMPSFIAGD